MGSSKKKTIKAVMKRPGKEPYEVIIRNELKELQELVEGYVESFPLPGTGDIVIVCNEEGKYNGMTANFKVPYDIIFGPVLFLGRAGEEFDDCPVSADVIKGAIMAWRSCRDM